MNDTNLPSTSTFTPRRSSRQPRPSLRAKESKYVADLKNVGLVKPGTTSEEEDFEEYDFSPEKPKLLHDSEVVMGEEIFKFHKPKPREALALKVAEIQKTPHHIRSKVKSRIKTVVEFEDSGSEYEASTSEESSDSESSNSSSNSRPQKVKFSDSKRVKTNKNAANSDYTIKTDEYFSNSSSNKVKTSNNTLDKLEIPRLPQYQLQKLLSNMTLSKEHSTAIKKVLDNTEIFKKWLYILNENFNLLLYGLGSKRDILNSFRKQHLQDPPVIVVNGYFPTVSVKEILDGILVDLLELSATPKNINDACDLIEKEFKNMPEENLYIIINNIDGETLRSDKTQGVLARLSTVINIHLIATIDHINAPLIWDQNKLSKFNFIWLDVTSFLPYTEETSFEKSTMVQQSGIFALSSLRNIFQSLTTNSKTIYLKIVKHQIENSGQYYQGMAFKDLYVSCRDSFTVSSDLALRAQLNEFLDHKMVKTRRSAEDGTEYLIIPLANNILQKFVDETS